MDEDDIITDFQNRGYGTRKSRPSENILNVLPTLIANDMPRHKYNTMSGVGYASTVIILKRNEDILKDATHYINHILHPEIGKKCGYNQLVNDRVPGQSP